MTDLFEIYLDSFYGTKSNNLTLVTTQFPDNVKDSTYSVKVLYKPVKKLDFVLYNLFIWKDRETVW